MSARCDKYCLMITSCGLPQNIILSSLVGSLYAFPLLLLFRLIHTYFPMVAMWGLGIMLFISFIALYRSLRLASQQQVAIALDKMWGMVVVFIHIPLLWKFVVVGFISFHVIRVLMPWLGRRLFSIDFYHWGMLPGLIALTLCSGLVVNGMLHLMLWMVS